MTITWRGPVQYLEKIAGSSSSSSGGSSSDPQGVCPKVQRARIFQLCVNTIAELAELRRRSSQSLSQPTAAGAGATAHDSESAQPVDDLLSPRTDHDDAALRSTAKLALADAARTLQPAWEHVFDCCEIAEESLTMAAVAAASTELPAGSKQQQRQRLPFTAFMQSVCGLEGSASVDPLQYRYIAYMLDALVRFKQSLPAPWETTLHDDKEAMAMAVAAAGWAAPAEAVALGGVAIGVAPLVRSVSMIQPLNEGQCDAISASTRRRILRSTFNIDPIDLHASSSSSSSSSSSARGGHGQHAKAMGLMPTGRDSAAAAAAAATSGGGTGGSARDLGSPLVATLFSWPKTLAMLSQHYSSPERDADSFFHLLEPFHTKEAKFRRCMRELLPHTVNSGSSSGSGSTRGGGPSSRPGRGSSSSSGGGGSGSQGTHQKLLLKVHRGEALRGDVFAQLAELRAQNDKDDDSSTPSSDSGGDDEAAGSATSSVGGGGGGRPWLCRHLEDTKPWFVDGMGEGKGVMSGDESNVSKTKYLSSNSSVELLLCFFSDEVGTSSPSSLPLRRFGGVM